MLEQLDELAKLTGMQKQTLKLWSNEKKREGHIKILISFNQAIKASPEYSELLDNMDSPMEIAKKLSIEKPWMLELPIPKRTFKDWFESEDKKRLVSACIVGWHFGVVSDAAQELQIEPAYLIEMLRDINVSPMELVELYTTSKVATTKIVMNLLKKS